MVRGSRAAIAVVLGVLSAAVACGATAAAGTAPTLAVSPPSGHARTTFTVHFTAPAPSGRSGTEARSYHLSAAPAKRRSGCVDSVAATPIATTANQAMAVRLAPRNVGGRWCTEKYTGEVTETIQPACSPILPGQTRRAIVCPQYIALVPIGTFSFRVTR